MNTNEVSAAISRFSFKFYKEIDKSKSTVSSPLSFEYLLALLTLGSTDPAHTELMSVLELKDDDFIRSAFTAISAKWKSVRGVTLNVANKLYIKTGPYEFLPQLKDDAINIFDAEIEKVDFTKSSTTAACINSWVDIKTNGRIKDLIASDSFNEDTRAVLVNAIYFKGIWKYKFNPHNTIKRQFHLNNLSKVLVPMMFNEDNYKYAYSGKLQAQLLEMNYIGGEASMVIVLPNEIEGLDKVLNKLTDGCDLLTEMSAMYLTKVKVTIPKFKIETTIDVNYILSKLGINAIFQSYNSGLTKILDNNEPLLITKAIQKAFIEVNEEGSEAAAASALCGGFGCAAPREIVQTFVANRPFFAAILVNRTPYFLATHRYPV